MRDAEEYTISIRLESIEGDRLYVARVEELPDVEEYADTYEFARQLALDTIKTTQKIFERKGLVMPSPKVFSQPDVSGRVTLRLPRSLHAKCISDSEREGVSLNSYIMTCIASYKGHEAESITSKVVNNINKYLSEVNAKSLHSLVLIRANSSHYSIMRTSEISIDRYSGGDDEPCADISVESAKEITAPVSFSSKVLPC